MLKEQVMKIAKIKKENSSQFLVVLIPIRHQVNLKEWELICQTYNLNRNDYAIDKPQMILKAFCKDKNIHCLDLLPILRNRHIPSYYLHEEAHFNKHGHMFAAKLIYRYIKDKGLIDEGES